MLQVALNDSTTRFLVRGGEPAGGDKINRIVSSWPGWARVAVASAAGRSQCSTYAGPLSIPSALALSSTRLELRWEDGARERAGVLLRSFEAARSVLEGSDRIAPHWIPGVERVPREHQTRGVEAMIHLGGRVLLADEMGLGKSSSALWLASALGSDRLLVLCPASVKFNWANEILATLGDDWPVCVIDGSKRARTNQFSGLRAQFTKAERLAIVINYDLLKHLTPEQLTMLGRFTLDRMVVMDESHYLKNHESERTKIVKRTFCPFDGGAQWRIAMSGTPIRNTVEDLYSQVELVKPGTFQSYHWFLSRFTVRSTMKVKYRRGGRELTKEIRKVRRVANEAELNQIVNTLQIRRLKADVSDLPPLTLTHPELELDTYSRKVYDAMRDYALYLLEQENETTVISPQLSPTARTAVETAARCEQICQGCLGGVPEPLVSRLSSVLAKHAAAVKGKDRWLVFPQATKLLWLQEQLDTVKQQGGQSVVFSRFNAPLFWLADKRDAAMIHGGVPAKKRQAVFDLFQAGQIQEICVQVRIAEGFNLFAAQDEFFLGRDWAWSVNAQAMARCHRDGQTSPVNVQAPNIRGTIEVRQHAALGRKELDADNTLCFRTIADLKAALA